MRITRGKGGIRCVNIYLDRETMKEVDVSFNCIGAQVTNGTDTDKKKYKGLRRQGNEGECQKVMGLELEKITYQQIIIRYVSYDGETCWLKNPVECIRNDGHEINGLVISYNLGIEIKKIWNTDGRDFF